MKTWAIIYNPKAGRFREHRLLGIKQELESHSINVRLLPTAHPGHATEIVRELQGVDVIATFGGDGTLNEAACGLIGRNVPLAFLPGGTANGMALELGLPQHPVRAARLLARGRPVAVRPGIINGRCFLLMAGIGFDGEAVAGVTPGLKARLGKAAYVLTSLRALLARQPRLMVEGGGVSHGPSAWVVVARARHYGGPFVLHPHAGLTVQELRYIAVGSSTLPPLLIARFGLRWKGGSDHGLSPEQDALKVHALTPVAAQVDGEFLERNTRFSIEQATETLTLLVPGGGLELPRW